LYLTENQRASFESTQIFIITAKSEQMAVAIQADDSNYNWSSQAKNNWTVRQKPLPFRQTSSMLQMRSSSSTASKKQLSF